MRRIYVKTYKTVVPLSLFLELPLLLNKSLSFAPLSDSDIQNAVKLLRPLKACGVYGIPTFVTEAFLKICACSRFYF
jgi:hypothetical protein